MSTALLRKAIDKSEARDTALKWSLLQRVNDCVKELQLKCTSERTNALNNDEGTNSFLWALEAVFIHGLNNSFLKSSSAASPFSSFLSSFGAGAGALGGNHRDTSPAVPNPSFWEFVLVFLHRDLIDQINSLHLIHTDVGRSRAWLRIALNEGLLQSFLENMTLKSNRRCLKAFYRSSAFLRDTEKSDILKNYLMGVELLDFRLVINNSFLNHWNSGPLSLVGLWVDENECVQEGVDIAKNLESKEFQAIPKLQQRQTNSQTPPRFYSELDSVLRRAHQPPLLSEDDALRIILSSSPRHISQPPVMQVQPVQPTKALSSSSSSGSDKSHQHHQRKRSTSSQKSSGSSSKNAEITTEDLPDIAEEVKFPEEATPPQVEASNQLDSGISSSLSNHQSPATDLNEPDPTPKNESPSSSPGTPELPGTLELPSPSQKVISSSPTSSSSVQNTPKQLSTSISSIELESPGDNERSYTDLLLKYQQRSQNQNQSQTHSDELRLEDDSYSHSNHINHNHTAASTSDLIANSSSGGGGGSSSGGRSRKASTTGSMNTTTTSGASTKSSKFTRSRASQLLSSQTTEHRLELLRLPHATREQVMELVPRIGKFTKILATEQGLDSQNYSCKNCSTSIGMIYGPGRLCHFTGALYCTSCHTSQERVIPSRILLNWDFGLYQVCKQAYEFLDDLKDEAIFDMQEINPILYTEIDECQQVKKLRTKLFYIGMYLKTCKNAKALEALKKEMELLGKEHLLESIHVYTLSDLLMIPSRSLANLVIKLVGIGSSHILSCTICREKGFICEVCRKPQVIFPFELERIFKCGECGAVYHNTCMDHGKKCPRCERWKRNNQNEDGDGMDCDDH